MDSEDFQIWKESTATQWVLKALGAIGSRVQDGMKDRLVGSALLDGAGWAALQVNAADAAGYVRAINEMIELEFEDVSDK